MKKIQLPSKITKDSWFYEANKELCEPHLGKYYISNSSVDSWENYKEDFIKQKFAKIKLPEGTYAALGSYLGEAVENGEFGDNPHGFTGQENFNLIDRPENAEYEKMILIDRGDYVIIGFIDILLIEEQLADIQDLKTGGNKKEDKYTSKDYVQVILYAYALELLGYKIRDTSVWFVRRTGSHVKPPLHISSEQFKIPLEYNKDRIKYALDKVDRVVKEVSELYIVYKRYFA